MHGRLPLILFIAATAALSQTRELGFMLGRISGPSRSTIDGANNQAPRFTHRGAFDYAGGADFPVKRWIGGRIEVRDFITGSPSFNVPTASGVQHNVVFSYGILLFFGRTAD
jgi:hypothetical protein